MFKAGDVVEITEVSDATGMLDFKKGKGYTVELYAGGMVNVVNESGKLGWYSKHHFKLKEKEEKKVETLFKEGQVVWDVVYGKGVVVDILENHSYPVVVEFEEGVVSYTNDGRTCKTHGRTLFFSEPKIEAATEPLFEPVLKKGQPVILTRLGLDVQMLTGWVHEEHQKDIEIRTANDLYITYSKDKWAVHYVGEKIEFN